MLVDAKQLIRVITVFSCYIILCETVNNKLHGCTKEIYVTNEYINNMVPGMRDTIIMKGVENYSFEDIIKILLPPDLSMVNKSEYDFFNFETLDTERILQGFIKSVTNSQIDRDGFDDKDIEEYMQSYEEERNIRRKLLLPAMNRVLHYTYGLQNMCQVDNRKCVLIALIKSFGDSPKTIDKVKCIENYCHITETIREDQEKTTAEQQFYDIKKYNIHAACYVVGEYCKLWMVE